MDIQDCADGVILVKLPRKPQEHDNLQHVIEMVSERCDCSVVIDFSRVGAVGGTTFSRLLELRRSLQERGGRLVLCSIGSETKGVFTVTRLDELFDFAEDKPAAFAQLHVQV